MLDRPFARQATMKGSLLSRAAVRSEQARRAPASPTISPARLPRACAARPRWDVGAAKLPSVPASSRSAESRCGLPASAASASVVSEAVAALSPRSSKQASTSGRCRSASCSTLTRKAELWGARSRDKFIDGSLTLTRPVYKQFSAGFGVWGGAQPGVYRVDAGPRVTMHVRKGVRVHFDWRQRLAGNARPGSGPAVTLAGDF